MEHHFMIKNADLHLAATLHYPKSIHHQRSSQRFPILIICHGFISNRIGMNRLFVDTARKLCEHDYIVLRFDYGGCGESTGEYGESGLDSMIEQTGAVIKYCMDMDFVDPNNIILLGHSLGGAVALLTASLDKRIKKLILWSSVAHPFRDIVNIIGQKAYKTCLKQGSVDYLGYTLTLPFFESLGKYEPFKEVRNFKGEVLVVHGNLDEEIPVEYCFLYQKAFWLREHGGCDKEIIPQADHTFSDKTTRREVIERTVKWLDKLGHSKEWNDWMI